MKTVKYAIATAALLASGSVLALKEGLTRKDATAASAKKFGQMDSDGNGKVSQAEIGAFMAKSSAKRGETLDQAKVDRRVKRLDTDGDGAVSAAELLVEELEKFDKADVNKNGKIDAAEAAA